MKEKPILNERFADNGSHSHWELLNSDGEIICTEFSGDDNPCQYPKNKEVEQIHVTLPSGAVARVDKGADKELLDALDAMAEKAKKIGVEKTQNKGNRRKACGWDA